jgi:GMP synthase (glutamine-hydrolysing)
MKIQCITHADFETPGVITSWAKSKGHDMRVFRPYRGEKLNDASEFGTLIVMGGPQSPLQINEAPYLKDEILHIHKFIGAKKPILGFCLGAQLIGEALGGHTERSPEKELGVYPIKLTKEGQSDFLLKGFPPHFNVIHWHNDMPGLTSTAQILAESVGCPRQIVRFGKRIYGFQCHLEITLDGIKTMIEACPGDLSPSRFTQTKADLLKNNYVEINERMLTFLDNFYVQNH